MATSSSTSYDVGGFGHQNGEALAAATKTLAITDQGDVQNVTVDTVITLPATVVGYTFTVRVGGLGLDVAISPDAADLIAGAGFTAADNTDISFINQPAGSWVTLVGNGTTGWNIVGYSGQLTQD